MCSVRGGAPTWKGQDVDEDDLIIVGRVLSRTGQPRFRNASLVFQDTNYDTEAQTTSLPESIDCELDEATGVFRVVLNPRTNGEGFMVKLVLVAFDGQPYVDYRICPPTGRVDYFSLPKATNMDAVRLPTDAVPVLISDYGKPGGPLQLTDNGTIAEENIPPDFLRIGDDRLPELKDYVTKAFYLQDQIARRSTEVQFTGEQTWEYDHGLPYHPHVVCVETDGNTIMGGISYPVNTTKVIVDFDAPTSGTMYLK